MKESLTGWMSEIRSFYINNPRRPLSISAQALWHYLMYRANELWWHQPITLHMHEITGAIGMSDSNFKRARQELVENHLLLHEIQTGNRTPSYVLLSNIVQGEQVHCGNKAGGWNLPSRYHEEECTTDNIVAEEVSESERKYLYVVK